MNIILDETISPDESGKWRYNFNPQSPGTYRIEINPIAADGTTFPPYFKDIVVTQEEIDMINSYKNKKYYDIHDIGLASLNTEVLSIDLDTIPKSKMYPGEQDTRTATITFNQSYYYTEDGESTIYIIFFETGNELNTLSKQQFMTQNQNNNYADEDDDDYDPNIKSYISGVEFDPKILMMYDSVSIKMIRDSVNGDVYDIYNNTIKVKDYLGPYDDGKQLQQDTIVVDENYRIATLDNIIEIGMPMPHIIITKVDGGALDLKNIKIYFEINIEHIDLETNTVYESNTLIIDNNIVDYNLDITDKAHAIRPNIRFPYIHEGKINVVIQGTRSNDDIFELAKISYNWIY